MQLRRPVDNTDHIKGNINASIEIVEYGDYQCPYCGAAFPLVKEMMLSDAAKVKFVFRNFPLTKIHPLAKMAATAAEAAALQRKFWEMHDALFENQKHLTSRYIHNLAENVSLDMNEFEKELQSVILSEKIDADFFSGMRSGVNRTPTFFVNGKRYEGSPEELVKWVKETNQ